MPIEGELSGRVALVTGASRGIGAAIARRFAAAGATVAVSARTVEPDGRMPGSLAETVDAITAAGGSAVAFACDLSSAEDRQRLAADVLERFGRVDVLVNNAAVTFLGPVIGFSEKRWRLMVELQLRAPYELSQLVLPGMRERNEGWILNISSRAAEQPVGPPYEQIHVDGGWSVYGMVKAGLERFTTALAAEGSAYGVRANTLAPKDNVATPGAGAHMLVGGFVLEDESLMAEAALALCSTDLTGRIALTQPLLAELGRTAQSV
jgi:citronellol/citronellal dehydrogenase